MVWRLALLFCLATWLLIFIWSPAYPHDIYSGLQSNAGTLCCGDTDCEGLEEGQFKINLDGSVTITSNRHKRTVLVAEPIVIYAGLPPNAKGEVFPAHWCGSKRSIMSGPVGSEPEKPTAMQPDPTFVTFCLFIAPGGA